MKFLIAGLGSIGRRHFRNLVQLGHKDITLLRSHKSTLPDDELAGYPVEIDLEKALAGRPDAVIISNPSSMHLPVALAAVNASCHIFLEKPVAHSHYGTQELLQAVELKKVIAAVGFQFRFHPGLQAIHDLIQQGRLGKIISATATWGEYLPGWHPWEDYRQSYAARQDLGGGVVQTLCHPLDYLVWLFGRVDMVKASVHATGILGIDVDDLAEIDLSFAAGTQAHVHLDYHRQPGKHTLSITGTGGTVEWDNATGITQYILAGENQWHSILPPAGFERNTMFQNEMRNFIQAIEGSEWPVCSLEEGIYNLQVIDAVYRAGSSGNPVKMAENLA